MFYKLTEGEIKTTKILKFRATGQWLWSGSKGYRSGGGKRVILLFIAKHLISVEGIRRALFVNSRRRM